jgi:hypothetical protein
VHQQVRTSTTKTGSESGGPGAAYDDSGSLVDILTKLAEGGVNLQAAGGSGLDRKDGTFVFSVHHGANDDDGPGEEAASLLRKHGYDARAVLVHHCVVSDKSGSLLECIHDVEDQGPSEIHVGTQGDYDGIPIQVVTRAALDRSAAS